MAWDQAKAEEAERLVANAPSAADLAKKQMAEQIVQAQKHLDRVNRIFCIEQATKACAVGGYEIKQILELADGYYRFLTTTKT